MRIKLYRKFVWCEGLPGFGLTVYYFVITDENDNLLYLKHLNICGYEDLEKKEGEDGPERRLNYPTWERILRELPSRFANSEIVSKKNMSNRKIERIWEDRCDKTQVNNGRQYDGLKDDYIALYDDAKKDATWKTP